MDIVLVGLNHRSAPVEVREKLAIGKSSLCEVLCDLKRARGIWECGVISTCNRIEAYLTADEEHHPLEIVKDFLSRRSGQPRAFFEPSLYFLKQPESVRHIFRVASGLDAMMVGEKEIVAQVKEAYEKAVEAGAAGIVLNALFQRALRVSKKVRTETRIDAGAVSVSSAAVELAKKIFGGLSDRTVMVLGAGQTSEQTLKHLVDEGVGAVVASNRSYDRAVELALAYGGKAIPLDECIEELTRTDIVISSTAAPHPILRREHLPKVMRRRRNRPLFLIDIAVPRDIEADVNELDNVYLYNIDDLKEIAEVNLRKRRQEMAKCDRIIEREVSSFVGWLNSLQATPVIRKLHQHFESVRAEELEGALSKLPGLSDEAREKVDAMTRRMIKRLLHLPTIRIKKAAKQRDGSLGLGLISNLFGLDQNGKEER
jgi:glutamyl-tRNA reductase